MPVFDYDDPLNAQCNELMDFVRQTVIQEEFQSGKDIRALELGCGTGPMGRRILAEYPNVHVTGVEVLPERIDALRRILASTGLTDRYQAILGDITIAGLFPEGAFDVILAPSVLHHFEGLRRSPVPGNLRCWLRPGGYLVIQDPNGANPVQQLSNQVMRIAVRYSRRLRAYKWPGETMYSPAYFRRVFRRAGLKYLTGCVCNPRLPVRDTGVPLLGLRNRLNNAVANVTWGDCHGTGQLLVFQKPG